MKPLISRNDAVTLPQAALARGAHAPSRVLPGALAGQGVSDELRGQTPHPVCRAQRDSARAPNPAREGACAPRAGSASRSTASLRLSRSLLALALLATARAAVAAPVDDALGRAAQFLISQQDPKGAIWEQKAHLRNQTAMTALSVLALTAMGHQPGDPTPAGEAVRKGLAFVLLPENQDKDGYFGKDGSRMYGHGITTLMVSEMLGMGADAKQDEQIRTSCRKGIELILRAQKVQKAEGARGGWRYTPDSGDSDMSVTVWQTMALRAARNAGMDVPKEAIDDAVRYIKRCYDPGDTGKRAGPNGGGGFGYQNRGREISTTAEGLLALQVCGQYDSEEVVGASDRLLKDGVKAGERWFFYASYYYAQGMYQRGGKYALEGKKTIPASLVPLQARDGSWDGINGEERQGGKIYATCMAVLSLAVKNHYLPIYQR